ncbi:callose synthase 7-like isoform X2 [Ananas comosus]|uniref:1,3-beta-glucan synthase n=1 Tax=Ananas comosus TaxID=4615 RepID=A0A6P5FRK2_ANACO|nr:callose synthase 7-like isoform X2 [Ananas comosus]
MASGSGSKAEGGGPSRRMTRLPMRMDFPPDEEPPADSEIVPSSLASIVPILRVANEIELLNPRVAYLCRFHAFEKARFMDPTSSGRGVRQFKTYLIHKLEQDEEETKPILARTDAREIQKFYQWYYETYVKDAAERKPEEAAKHYQIASVLYDVLKSVVPYDRVDVEVTRYAYEVESKREHFANYNILPLNFTGPPLTIMELPEIKAAVDALRKTDNLPKPRRRSGQESQQTVDGSLMPEDKSIDLLDWLGLTFGFQKGNVENQKEHLILLLANINARRHPNNSLLDTSTVKYLMDKVFGNYRSWCAYLHHRPNFETSSNVETQQLELLYIGLYFLIWGEASNVRFMPECICYIFHCMAKELNGILLNNAQAVTGGYFERIYQGEESFLCHVIQPIYEVICKEALRNKGGTGSHSKWRNYDDLNEYFWSNKCFELKWPLNLQADFFVQSNERHYIAERHGEVVSGRRKPKTNFVEVRTFWHLFRSFDRMWTFFILAFQAMIIVAWSPSGSLSAFFDPDVFRNVLSIFITAALLNFLRAALDIILSWRAWGSMEYMQIARYLLKFAVAAAWIIILLLSYSSSVQNPTGLIKYFSNWVGNWRSQSLYSFAIAIYMIPNILAALLFLLPPLRRSVERSNWRIIIFLMWWAQPRLYVARGMHEDVCSLLKYTLFWILLLVSKLAFSYYVEIRPLVEPTKTIMGLRVLNYEWHEFFSYLKHNIGIVITIWSPIVLVYFMDTQIWYAIFSSIFGGIIGAFNHLGEIRTLGMLRSRFVSMSSAFSERLVPGTEQPNPSSKHDYKKNQEERQTRERSSLDKFSLVWNAFINSLREEDLLSNREKGLLLFPSSSHDVLVVQWPPFLLASKIYIALDMAKDFKGTDEKLIKKIKRDNYMLSAVIECYETTRYILYSLFQDQHDKDVIQAICANVESSRREWKLLSNIRMSELPQLSCRLEKLLNLLKSEHDDLESVRTPIINVLQDVMEIITQDVMVNGPTILERFEQDKNRWREDIRQKYENIDMNLMTDPSWMEKVVRLHLLLTVKESAINVPTNLDARRRMTFFANSLFMKMPTAPEVREMMSFSVLTPYYKEEVLYSEDELRRKNEDGISTLFYLQKIYPDEWSNFLERIKVAPMDENSLRDKMDEVRHWVSYRGQTLARTVNLGGSQASYREQMASAAKSKAIADIKFTYVVSCQIYGVQKASKDPQEKMRYYNILNLMLKYPSLRVAYIDEKEEMVDGTSEKRYYSVLVKGGDKWDQEIYRIRLPGEPTAIGEGKPENQNHAIIFTRGEALQAIDMIQDNYLEEAFKIRNVLEEFDNKKHGKHKPTILGLREHIFTGSVSSLARFVSNQETSFVTIGQRILANPLRVRFHYGHSDVFDRIFHITRGGISKASKVINLSGDIFAGFNSIMRGGRVTHHEYMQVGKGRDVGMNQISLFEAKVGNGNGEQTLSRDVFRLGRRFDFYRMLSFYFTTVGFYFSSMVTVLAVYLFLYGRLYLVMSGLERSILEDPRIQSNLRPLESALALQSIFQLGLLLVLPMVMEVGLEKKFRTAIGEFIIMQLELASVFFAFQLGTKVHYYGQTILHGRPKYRGTGLGFVIEHAKFADNYRLYSRSHFIKGLELMILLVVYLVYGESYRSSSLYLFVTFSMWFLVASWLLAPFVFNPSGFEWENTINDWGDWKKWMRNRGGIGIPVDRSWESWWESEQGHLRSTSIRGLLLEIFLGLRFLIYQYGIVYHLNIAHHSRSIRVYALSWLVVLAVLVVLKILLVARQKFGTDFQLIFRIVKGLLFLGFVSGMIVLFVRYGLTISDVFACILGFMPTGWALLLIGQACRPLIKMMGFWDSIKELGRAYEYVMGIIIFMPIAVLSWFPFISEFHTRLLFNQAFSRRLQIRRILAGQKDSSYDLRNDRKD